MTEKVRAFVIWFLILHFNVQCWEYYDNNFYVQFFDFSYAENQKCETIRYYEKLITNAQRTGLVYKLPENNAEFAAKDKALNYGTFDYIIIGGGAAGTVIANRLSANPNWEVLLIEAGTWGDNLTDIPNMYFPVEFTRYNWGYHSVPQSTACLGMVDQKCPFPRGKGVGGTTLINGLVYSRGSALDFDHWAALGNPGWSYKDVLPFFEKSERFNFWRENSAPVDFNVHGLIGELNVEYHLPNSPQLDAFLSANQEAGYQVADYNGGTGLGASPAQVNTREGRRWDGGKAFIHNIVERTNLQVLTGAYVTKILINETTVAYGVAFNSQGRRYEAAARREIILSAGAINSPQVLMLSGVGPKRHLADLKIPVVRDLEVGSTLRDHATFYGLNFRTNYSEPIRPLSEYIRSFLEGVGPLAAPGNNQGVGFYESSYSKGTGLPDIEIMFIPSNATTDLSQKSFRFTDETYEDVWGRTNRTSTLVMYIVGLHAESYGTIRLKSSNPLDYPLIDPNFLSDEKNKDINTLYEGIQLALKLANTKALQKLGATLQGGPLRACKQHRYQTKAYWFCALRQVTMNLYHPVGTCPMGPDPRRGAVVDAQLRVYGVGNLRVADASVFPTTLAGHPNAPAVMVGEKVAHMIINDL